MKARKLTIHMGAQDHLRLDSAIGSQGDRRVGYGGATQVTASQPLIARGT